MNIIINGLDQNEQLSIVKNIINDYNIDYLLYIIGTRDELNTTSKLARSVFVVPEIIFGNYSFHEQLLPLDTDIIKKMTPFEPAIMRQMDRFEVYLKRAFTYDERKEIYYKHLKFWNHIFLKTKIDLFISSNIPHDIYDYVIYSLCKIYHVKSLYFYQSQIKDIIHPMTEWEEFTTAIPILYESLINNYRDTPIASIPLGKEMEEEWELLHQDLIPFYMKNKKFNIPDLIFSLAKHFLRLITGLISINGLFRKFQNYKLDKEYHKLAVNPDLEKLYIYFPLHYQPELTSCPLGGVYADQYLIVQLIESLLPEGYFLYVKEHPKQEFAGRHYNYYKNLIENTTKVKLISKKTNSFDLIRNSKSVVTISGTAGWESLFRNKPVLLFGHNFYQYAPGVFNIKTTQDCRIALEQIFNNDLNIDQKNLKIFLKTIEDTSIKGFVDIYYAGVSNFNTMESSENIYTYIKTFIEKIKE